MRNARPTLLAVIALLLWSLPAPAQQTEPLTAETLVGLQRVGQAVLDPSGTKVAYTVITPRTADDPPGGSYSELWVVDLSGGEPRRFIGKPNSVSSPAWSPDGSRLTFLATRSAHSPVRQVYAMPVAGGEALPLTDHPVPVASYQWAPDGNHIAFIATDEDTPEEKEARAAGRDWQVFDDSYKHRRLWVFDVGEGHSHPLYEEPLTTWAFNWMPDGRTLVMQASDTPRTDDQYMYTDLYKLELHGDGPQKINDTEGKLGGFAVSPDGDELAWLGATGLNDPIAQSLFVSSLTEPMPGNLTDDYEGSAVGVQWLDDGTLLMLADEGTMTSLYRVDAATGGRTEIPTEGKLFASVDAHPASGRYVAVGHTPSHPAELFAGRLDGGELTRVTFHNPELDDVRLARQETVSWSGADGWQIAGVLTYPLDYVEGQRYPLVLQVHGGPEGVSLDGWTSTATYPVQLLAAAGYMVLQPNYRGSAGRGVAFSKADHDDLGGKEYEDVLAGIDALVERGLVDGERVGTGGWSYGGYFSAWAATRHSERFKAAVVAAGLTNWVSFTGTTDIPHEMSLVHWNQYWWDNPELHWERSPVAHIDNAQTATLIVHGTADARVHPEQSIQLYTFLRMKEVPTELVLYPRQPHGLVDRAHQIDFAERVVGWFDTYLK